MSPGKALGSVVSCGVGLFLLVAVAMQGARADTVLTDPLDNWSLVAWHSPGLTLDSSNPQWFGSDTSRVKRTGIGQEGLYYHTPGAIRMTCKIYYFEQFGETDVYCSSDLQSWTQVPTHYWPQTTTSGWSSGLLEASSLPASCNYVGIRLVTGSQSFSPQIGEVHITYDPSGAASVSIPSDSAATRPGGASVEPATSQGGDSEGAKHTTSGGLTVMAANGLASVDWLSVPGASKYRLARGPEATSFHLIADGISGTHFRDQGLKPGVPYYYVLTALKADGSVASTENMRVIPEKDGVVFDDPLTDWSLCADHTDNLELTKSANGAQCVRRKKTTDESVEYNLPGASRLAVTVYYDGDLNDQFSVDASTNGIDWNPVTIANTTPAPTGASSGAFATVCSVKGPMPANTNFLRLNLKGAASANSPAISNVRLTYGLLPRGNTN